MRALLLVFLSAVAGCAAPEASVKIHIFERSAEDTGAGDRRACWAQCTSLAVPDPTDFGLVDDALCSGTTQDSRICADDELDGGPSGCCAMQAGASDLLLVTHFDEVVLNGSDVGEIEPGLTLLRDGVPWDGASLGTPVRGGVASDMDHPPAGIDPIEPFWRWTHRLGVSPEAMLSAHSSPKGVGLGPAESEPLPLRPSRAFGTFEQWVRAESCWAPCSDASPFDIELPDHCPTPSPCTLIAGDSRVRLIGGASDGGDPSATAPTAALFYDGASFTGLSAGTPLRLGEIADFSVWSWTFALPLAPAQRLDAQVTRTGSLAATVGENLTPPVLTLDWAETPDDELAAGLGVAVVEIHAPQNVAKVTLVSRVDGVQDSSQEVTLPASPDENPRFATVAVDVPDDSDAQWSLQVSKDDLFSNQLSVGLRRPAAPVVVVSTAPPTGPDDPTFDPENPPGRAVWEPPGCDEVIVSVYAPDAPEDGTVTLSASAGSLGAEGGEVVIPLSDGFGWIDFSWERAAVVDDPEIRFEATAPNLPTGSRTWRLRSVLPTGGTIAAATPQIEVSDAGSSQSSATVVLTPPHPDAPLGPDLTLSVVAGATADSSALECGPPVSAVAVQCNPTLLPQVGFGPGGCLLTPNQPLLADGATTGTLTLDSSVCWSGVLELQLFAETADPAGGCLGSVSAEEGPHAVGALEEVTYVPAAPAAD